MLLCGVEYRWQRLQLLSHLGRGHVPHGQDAITGQINCNCEYLLESENFLHSSYFLEEYTMYHVNYSRQEKSLVDVGKFSHSSSETL